MAADHTRPRESSDPTSTLGQSGVGLHVRRHRDPSVQPPTEPSGCGSLHDPRVCEIPQEIRSRPKSATIDRRSKSAFSQVGPHFRDMINTAQDRLGCSSTTRSLGPFRIAKGALTPPPTSEGVPRRQRGAVQLPLGQMRASARQHRLVHVPQVCDLPALLALPCALSLRVNLATRHA